MVAMATHPHPLSDPQRIIFLCRDTEYWFTSLVFAIQLVILGVPARYHVFPYEKMKVRDSSRSLGGEAREMIDCVGA